jgi:hypothetical protein
VENLKTAANKNRYFPDTFSLFIYLFVSIYPTAYTFSLLITVAKAVKGVLQLLPAIVVFNMNPKGSTPSTAT